MANSYYEQMIKNKEALSQTLKTNDTQESSKPITFSSSDNMGFNMAPKSVSASFIDAPDLQIAVNPIKIQQEITDNKDNPSFFQGITDSIINTTKQIKDDITRKYIQPMQTYAQSEDFKQKGLLGLALEEANKNVQSDKLFSELPGIISGTVKGTARGVTLGFSDQLPGILSTKVGENAGQGEKVASSVSDFLGYMVPFTGAEKLLASGATRFIPEIVVKHPRLMRRIIDAASFLGTSQLTADLFKLTPEEEAQGTTLAQKRIQTAGMDALALGVFKSIGTVFNLLAGRGLVGLSKQVEDKMVDDAMKEITRRSTVISDHVALNGNIPGVEGHIVKTENIINTLDSIPDKTPEVQQQIEKARNIIVEQKAENPTEYIQEKYVSGTEKPKSTEDLGAQHISAQTNVDVKVIDTPVVYNIEAIRKNIPQIESQVNNKIMELNSIDVDSIIKQSGYKDMTDLELKSIQQSSGSGVEGDLLSTGFNIGGRDVSIGDIPSIITENPNVEDTIKQNIANALYDKFSADAGVSGVERTNVPNQTAKSMLKRILSYGKADSEKLSQAYKVVDGITNPDKFNSMIDSSLRMIADNVYSLFDSGKPIVIGRNINNDTVSKILSNFFSKGEYTVTGLAQSVNEVFNKKQAGFNPFNTANKAIKELGFSDIKDFSKLVGDATGFPLATNNELLITKSEANNQLDKVAKSKGKKNGIEFMVELESKRADLEDKNVDMSARDMFADLGNSESIEDLKLANEFNRLESQHIERKDLEGGFIRLGIDKKPVAEANADIDMIFNEKLSKWEQRKSSIKDLVDTARTFGRSIMAEPEVDQRIIDNYPQFVRMKIDMWNIPRKSTNTAMDMTVNVISGLKKEDIPLFEKIVTLSDFLVTKGRGKEVATGLSTEKVLAMLESLRAEYKANPSIKDAYMRHTRLFRAFRHVIEEEYKSRGFEKDNWLYNVPEDVKTETVAYLRDYLGISNIEFEDIYIPHIISKYTNEDMLGRKFIPVRVKKSLNPFTLKRGGSKEKIVTDYERVVAEYTATTLSDLAMDKKAIEMASTFDVMGSLLPDDLKAFKAIVKKPGMVIDAEQLPEYIRVQFPSERFESIQLERGNYVYPLETIDAKKMQAIMEDALNLDDALEGIDESTRKILAIGRKKPIFLVPQEIAQQMNRFNSPTDPMLQKYLRMFTPFTRTWKLIATKYFGFIAWRSFNSLQDVYRMMMLQPTSFNDLPESLRVASKIVWGKKGDMNETTKEFIDKLGQYNINVSGFLNSMSSHYVDNPNDNILKHWAKKADQQFDNVNSFLELAPKIASILDNIKRVENGKAPILLGADEYIQTLQKKGFTEEAMYSFGRGITVDYAAMPPAFRKYMSGFIAPFSFWFVRNAAGIYRALGNSIGLAAGYLAFLTATTLWNNQDQFIKFEQGLSPYERDVPHMWVGLFGGDPLKLNLDNPVNSALTLFGLNKIPSSVADIITKSITPDEFVNRVITMIPAGVSTFTGNMLNPIIKVADALWLNVDPFTHKQVIPDKYLGTTQGTLIGVQYLLGALATPLQQAIISDNETDWQANPIGWFNSLAQRPLDISRNIFKSYPAQKLSYNQEYHVSTDMKNVQSIYHENMFNALANGDSELFKTQLQDLIEGSANPDKDMQSLVTYLTSPSTEANFLRELKRRVTDSDKRDQMENLYYQFRRVENMKSVREDKLQEFMQKTFLLPEDTKVNNTNQTQ